MLRPNSRVEKEWWEYTSVDYALEEDHPGNRLAEFVAGDEGPKNPVDDCGGHNTDQEGKAPDGGGRRGPAGGNQPERHHCERQTAG